MITEKGGLIVAHHLRLGKSRDGKAAPTLLNNQLWRQLLKSNLVNIANNVEALVAVAAIELLKSQNR